jgi:PKD repeat protein
VVYTAPPQPPDHNDPEAYIRIYVTPVGTNYDNALSRYVGIRLVQPATIYVPGSPVAQFSYTPSSPRTAQDVFFDGSLSIDPDGSIVSYQWSYDDGDFETGMTQYHDFVKAGTYNVTLTVTDNAGNKASTTRLVTVQ